METRTIKESKMTTTTVEKDAVEAASIAVAKDTINKIPRKAARSPVATSARSVAASGIRPTSAP